MKHTQGNVATEEKWNENFSLKSRNFLTKHLNEKLRQNQISTELCCDLLKRYEKKNKQKNHDFHVKVKMSLCFKMKQGKKLEPENRFYSFWNFPGIFQRLNSYCQWITTLRKLLEFSVTFDWGLLLQPLNETFVPINFHHACVGRD